MCRSEGVGERVVEGSTRGVCCERGEDVLVIGDRVSYISWVLAE